MIDSVFPACADSYPFIQEVKSHNMDEPGKHRWRVGDRCIGVDDLVLLGLEHVSKGSWQVQLRLRRPLPN